MRTILKMVVGLLWTAAAVGQQAAVRHEGTGAVAGHVYCVDTNSPARFASVTLQPIEVEPEPKDFVRTGPPISTYQTMLDGSFSIQHVRPGTYYVVVQKLGYLSPIFQFTHAELEKPSSEMRALIAKAVPVISVEANHAATAEVRIERGAAIGGTVRYDDGSLATNMTVHLLTRGTGEKKGKRVDVQGSSYRSSGGTAQTDDLGRFRLTGMPGGEYLVEAQLEVTEIMADRLLGGGSSYWNTKYSLSVYSGGVVRQRDAKAVKLQEGEERSGEEILIPLSKLHAVSGAIVNKAGQVVNAGKVSLRFADDDMEVASTQVDAEDGMFHFAYVLPLRHMLKVAEANDVVRTEVSNGEHVMPPTHTETKVVKSYGPGQQALVVQNEVSGVVVPVPEKVAGAKVAAQ